MAPTRRSLGTAAPSPLVPLGERKPRRSFFTSSTKLPLALPDATPKAATALRPPIISLAEFAPAPDFVQTSLLPPTPVTTPAPAIGPRIKEVVSIRQSRRSVAAAEAAGLEKLRAEEEQLEVPGTESANDLVLTQPRASRASTRRDSQRPATPLEIICAPGPSPPAPVVNIKPAKPEIEPVATQSSIAKNFLEAGLYCQDADASPSPLITAALQKKPKGRGKNKSSTAFSFPPLPIEHGDVTFLQRQNDFVLPFNIVQDFEHGSLGSKKLPEKYTKLRGNVFPERSRRAAPEVAICHCEPASQCRIQCINTAMSYFCGKDCPSGDACVNKSLTKRKGKATKVAYTGLRGFGLVAAEAIKEGEFVIDYRGEVISLNLFYQRIRNEYKDKRNFYALAYDSDEVIDSGMRGNDARYINHGCAPNLEVRKYTTMGDGVEEYEVGFWASRDIEMGEELMYDYNFDSFSTIQRDAKNPDFVAPDEERRTRCNCGAPNCAGYLGKKPSTSKSASPVIDDAMEVSDEESEGGDMMDVDEQEVEEAILEPLKPAARQPRIPIELLKSRNLSNGETLKITGSLKLPPQLKKQKAIRKGIVVKNGVVKHKVDESRTVKTRSRVAAVEAKASVTTAAKVDQKLRRTRQNGLLSAAKKAIAQTNDMDVDEAVRVLAMSDKEWETERKRLKKGHEWKARQIALARKLIPELESVSPEKGRQLRKEKERQIKKELKESKEKLPRPTPAVLLDPSHCFRPDKWSSIRPQPVSPSQTLKSRVSMSALVTDPYKRSRRASQDQPTPSPAKASSSSSKAAPSKSTPTKSIPLKPPAKDENTKQLPARQRPTRTSLPKPAEKPAPTVVAKSTSKAAEAKAAGAKKTVKGPKRLMGRRSIADHEAAAEKAKIPIVADSASDMMLGKSKVKFISAQNNKFVDVTTGQVRRADPRHVALLAASAAEAEQRVKDKGHQKKHEPRKAGSLQAPLTSMAWAPPAAGPKLKFKLPSQLRDDVAEPGPSHSPQPHSGRTDYPPLPSATVTLPPSNITQLPRDLLNHVETRISKRRSALETERFSQGKGSAWFQSELDNVKEQEYSRAFAFVRQHHALSSSQHQLEAMTAEFTRGPSAESSTTPIDLSAFVSPPTPVAGNKRRSGSEFEYQTRKKPGTIRKTEAEWEEERRTRKKGLDWLRVMKNIHGVVPGGPLPVRTYRTVVISKANEPELDKTGQGRAREAGAPRGHSPTRYAPWTPVSASSSESPSQRKPHDFDAILSRPDPRSHPEHAYDTQGENRWDDDRIPKEPVSAHYR